MSKETIRCTKCGTINPPDILRCRKCEADLNIPKTYPSCEVCGKQTKFNYSKTYGHMLCKECGDKQKVDMEKPTLLSFMLVNWLNVIGWIYFLLSLIGSIILLSNAYVKTPGLYETSVNYIFIAAGIGAIISSIIVLLLCLGIARIIEQNIYLIREATED